MLKKGEKIVNLSAISASSIGKSVMYMSGTINLSENKFDTHTTVLDAKLYADHMDEAEKDCSEFRKWVKEEYDKMLQG